MTLDPLWLRVYRDVGGDRYLSPAELPAELSPARTLWETYDRMFGRFTGAGLDPLFFRFAHGDLKLATPVLPADVPVLIVGSGPSLEAGAEDLRRIRSRVMVASSPRGALALQARGLFADLVLVEHQSAFDAEASADTARYEGPPRLHPETAILADPATPADLLRHFDPERTRLAHALPTWGLWPATLAALALDGGAPMVGLLGVDLGMDGQIDPPHRPLVAVLEQLAHASNVCRDCGHAGPPKKGWSRVSLTAFAATSIGSSRRVTWRDEQSASAMSDRGAEDMAALQPLLPDARDALAMALRARAGDVPPMRDLTQAIDLMLAWGTDPRLRWMMQRGLGLSFLPQFWRTGVSVSEPRQLWRPIVLALHELTMQADRLDMQLRKSRLRGRASGAHRALPPPASAFARAEAMADHRQADATSSAGEARRVRTDPVVHATRISVLVPVKNGLPHLHDAVASLAAQTHPDIEILVIDDGSDDGGPQEILAQALSHVRVLRSTGHGMAAALNTGLRAATGAFIAAQRAGDWSHPERLARQFEYLLRHSEIDLLATSVDIVCADGRPPDESTSADLTSVPLPHDARTADARSADRATPRDAASKAFTANTVLARRACLRSLADCRYDLAGTDDEDAWLHLLPETRLATLPTRLYTVRLGTRQRGPFRGAAERSLTRMTPE